MLYKKVIRVKKNLKLLFVVWFGMVYRRVFDRCYWVRNNNWKTII